MEKLTYYQRNKEKIDARNKQWRINNPEKWHSYYKKYKESNPEKVKCILQKSRSKPESKEKKKISKKLWKLKNPEKNKLQYKRSYLKNKEKHKIKIKLFRKKNPDKVNSYNAYRRCLKKKACPIWLNKHHRNLIKEIYSDIDINSKFSYHVDHIIPLINDKVCGLHVPWNLQLLSATENLIKKNKFDGTYENLSWKLNK